MRGLARDVFPPVLVAPGWLGKEDLEGSWEALRGLARDVFPPVLVAPGWLGQEDLEREVGKL